LCAGDQSLALSFAARATFSRAASVTTQNSLSQRIEVSGAGTPPAIVNKINAGMVRMMADAAFAQRLINQGAGPRASTPAPFRGSMDASGAGFRLHPAGGVDPAKSRAGRRCEARLFHSR
jgi:hypothetical protein